jgi:deoxycytidylate deaminase
LKEACGAIIVKNNKILSTGCNYGIPVGTINLLKWRRKKISKVVLSCRCIHAEYNCILKAGITAAPGAVLDKSAVFMVF